MPAFTIVADKTKPAGFGSWEVIPGTDRAVLKVQNDLGHDSVLVIDANVSMKTFWAALAADFGQLAYALMDKDQDGIDIFFAGVASGEAADDDSPAGGYLNVSNPLFLLEAFQKIEATGFSDEEAVTGVVSSIFKKYLANYEATEDKTTVKGLNVILCTDGTFDQEPFEAVLVETAKAFEAVGAPKHQVGIQLLRVGDAVDVEEKFTFYDDELKNAHGLDRDLVDHSLFTPNGFTEKSITKICSGAVDEAQDAAEA